jgi:hydroxyacylglutathione hydrolase
MPTFPAVAMRPLTRWGLVRFWAAYWFWFLLLLPWMGARQVVISAHDLWLAWRTAGRTWSFLDGRLHIGFVGSWELLVTAGLFGERFTWIRWQEVIIDPGPARTGATVQACLDRQAPPQAIACTHWHEEHIGNAACLARRHGIPIWGSPATVAALKCPPPIPGGRSLLMGQAAPAAGAEVRAFATTLADLEVIAADGHCCGHTVLFARAEGILFAGDAFIHELFTSPNADTDHRAWIDTLERLSSLPVRTLVGAHGEIISSDPRFPIIPGVVRRSDPAVLIRDKLAFLTWAREVVEKGEDAGVAYSVIEASLFPWARTWSWRTWFHDEGFRLFTCGEFSRTHLVRSLSRTPQQVTVRFPMFLTLAKHLAVLGPELLRIHLLAARPEPVLVIAGSIAVSAAVLNGAAPSGSGQLGQDLATAAGRIIDARAWGTLAGVLAIWTWWWAVIGGAITRRMALAVAGEAAEPWATSLRWCLRPGVLLPSALASLCLLACSLAGRLPWLLLAIPPIWLIAGVLYAGCCLVPGSLRFALGELRAMAAHPWPFLRRQAIFLLGFLVSTGAVYLAAGLWWALMALITGGWWNATTCWLTLPAAVYALGYTTANLKSLLIWLFLRRDQP